MYLGKRLFVIYRISRDIFTNQLISVIHPSNSASFKKIDCVKKGHYGSDLRLYR